jgi:hypothetical protein
LQLRTLLKLNRFCYPFQREFGSDERCWKYFLSTRVCTGPAASQRAFCGGTPAVSTAIDPVAQQHAVLAHQLNDSGVFLLNQKNMQGPSTSSSRLLPKHQMTQSFSAICS